MTTIVLYTAPITHEVREQSDKDLEQNSNILHLHNVSYEATPSVDVL
jgi:hypothetical protein